MHHPLTMPPHDLPDATPRAEGGQCPRDVGLGQPHAMPNLLECVRAGCTPRRESVELLPLALLHDPHRESDCQLEDEDLSQPTAHVL